MLNETKYFLVERRSCRVDFWPWWVTCSERTDDLVAFVRPSPATKKYFLFE
jgi:hypothetical protein